MTGWSASKITGGGVGWGVGWGVGVRGGGGGVVGA